MKKLSLNSAVATVTAVVAFSAPVVMAKPSASPGAVMNSTLVEGSNTDASNNTSNLRVVNSIGPNNNQNSRQRKAWSGSKSSETEWYWVFPSESVTEESREFAVESPNGTIIHTNESQPFHIEAHSVRISSDPEVSESYNVGESYLNVPVVVAYKNGEEIAGLETSWRHENVVNRGASIALERLNGEEEWETVRGFLRVGNAVVSVGRMNAYWGTMGTGIGETDQVRGRDHISSLESQRTDSVNAVQLYFDSYDKLLNDKNIKERTSSSSLPFLLGVLADTSITLYSPSHWTTKEKLTDFNRRFSDRDFKRGGFDEISNVGIRKQGSINVINNGDVFYQISAIKGTEFIDGIEKEDQRLSLSLHAVPVGQLQVYGEYQNLKNSEVTDAESITMLGVKHPISSKNTIADQFISFEHTNQANKETAGGKSFSMNSLNYKAVLSFFTKGRYDRFQIGASCYSADDEIGGNGCNVSYGLSIGPNFGGRLSGRR